MIEILKGLAGLLMVALCLWMILEGAWVVTQKVFRFTGPKEREREKPDVQKP